MIAWKNMDALASYQDLLKADRVNIAESMSGEAGAERVKSYSVPMGEGMDFNYAARPVDENVLAKQRRSYQHRRKAHGAASHDPRPAG